MVSYRRWCSRICNIPQRTQAQGETAMRILSSMFLACALLTTLACSTNSVSNRNANQNTSFANPAFQTTARTIKNQRPEISDERLIQDGRMINEQSPAIVAYYEQRGFSKEQA